jgi:hypothetical protein
MRYFYSILVGLLIFACKRIEPLQGLTASFQQQAPPIQSKTIKIEFNMSYDSLFSFIGMQKGSTLFNSEKQAGLDFPIRLNLLNQPRIVAGKTDYVQLFFPVEVMAKPNIAGINAGLIQAKANLQVDFKWLWKDINHHQVDDIRLRYSWLAKPEMRVLGFPVSVQGIVDPLIQKRLPEIQTKLDSQVNQWLSPSNLIGIINRFPMNYPSEIGYVSLSSADVDIKNLSFEEQFAHANLQVRTALTIGDEINSQSANRWVDLQSAGNRLPIRVDYSFIRLKKLIAVSLKIKEEQIALRADSAAIHVELKGLSREKSTIQIDVKPLLLPDGRISTSWTNIHMQGIPVIMKGMTKRRIARGLQSFVWSVDSYLNTFNQNSWGLKLRKGKLSISALYFTPRSVGILGDIGGNWELKK